MLRPSNGGLFMSYITRYTFVAGSDLLHIAVRGRDTYVALDGTTQRFFRLPRKKVRFFSGRVVALPDGRAYLDTETFAKVWPRCRAKLQGVKRACVSA